MKYEGACRACVIRPVGDYITQVRFSSVVFDREGDLREILTSGEPTSVSGVGVLLRFWSDAGGVRITLYISTEITWVDARDQLTGGGGYAEIGF